MISWVPAESLFQSNIECQYPKSRENCSIVLIVAKRMPLGLILDRRTWLSYFWVMEPPMGEKLGGDEAAGCVPKIEETVGALVIIEACLGEDLADQEAG